MKNRRPPSLARALLRRLLPEELRDAIEGDLTERWRRREGPGADLWYWRQVLKMDYRGLRRAEAARRGSPHGEGDGMMRGIAQEFGQAFRSLRARPGLTAVVVVTLAFAVGATTAIFSVVNGVLLKPLPYPDSGQLINVYQTNEPWLESDNPQLVAFASRFPLSYPIYEGWRDRQNSFEGLGGYTGAGVTLSGTGGPMRVTGWSVTADLLPTLGVEPALGRLPGPETDRMGSEPVVVLSHELWQSRFGGDPGILDRTVTLDGIARPVIGVMPPGFRFPSGRGDLWITFDDALRQRGEDSQFMFGLGRLRPGVTLEAARDELIGIQAQTHTRMIDPPDPGTRLVNLVPRLELMVGDVRTTLLVLLGAVALVLLIASANIANLLFVAGLTRRREYAVRAALGAGSRRLVLGQVAEATLLVGVGGMLGFALAWAIHGPLVSILPASIPRQEAIALDLGVLGFALGLTALTTFAVSVLPAILAAGTDPARGLRENARGSSAGKGALRVRSALVVSEVALASVLLIAAGLLVNSYWRLGQVDLGFQAEGVASFRLTLAGDRYQPTEETTTHPISLFAGDLLRRLEEIPEVSAASLTTDIPMGNSTSSGSVYVGRAEGDSIEYSLQMSSVAGSYFDLMGMRFLAGGPWGGDVTPTDADVVVLNRTAAETLFRGKDPIGRQFRRGETRVLTVVGVLEDVRSGGVHQAPPAKMYLPIAGWIPESLDWVTQINGDPEAALGRVREAVWAVDPGIPLEDVRMMSEVVAGSLAAPRFRTFLIGSLGLLAGLLAVIGVGGMVAFVISQRIPEIGVRLALGAGRGEVVRAMTIGGLRLAVVGVVVGLVVALPLSTYLSDFLFGIGARDGRTFAAVSVGLLLVAGLASWWPARRAARVDPVTVLNAD